MNTAIMLDLVGIGDEVVVTLAGVCLVLMIFLYKTLNFISDNQNQVPQNLNPNGPTRTSDYDCSICLGETSFAVQTNCGHIYCGNCLLEVWRRSSQLSAVSCPYCRQRITLILSYFSADERGSAELEDVETRNSILQQIHTYNRRHSGEPRSLLEMLRDAPTLMRHLVTRLFSGEDGFNFAFQLRIFTLVLFWIFYLLSPLDLIPEAAFGLLGLLDDVVIFIFLSMYLTTIFRSVMAQLGQQHPDGVMGAS